MRAELRLSEHAGGLTVGPGNRVLYELATDTAHFGAAGTAGPTLRWELVAEGGAGEGGAAGGDPADDGRGGDGGEGGDSGEGRGGDGGEGGPAAAGRGGDAGEGQTVLATTVDLDRGHDWLMRCDRVDFPPGTVAYTHTHPGPGIRRLLFGGLTITTGGATTAYRAGGAWFESGPEPVYAEAAAEVATAFVRVMLLPATWAGRRTIRYVNPADADRPAAQRATVFGEQPLL